jgi:hypothetical protein
MRLFPRAIPHRPALLAFLAVLPAAGVAPPTITQAFGVATIPVGGTTSLTFTLTNTVTTLIIPGVTFTDTLPTGLVVATPNGLNGSCGGTVTAVAGSSTILLTGGSIPAVVSTPVTCVFSVNVTATAIGVLTTAVSGADTDFGTPITSDATITVTAFVPISPAPASWMLLGVGILALFGWTYGQSRWRRRSSSAGV